MHFTNCLGRVTCVLTQSKIFSRLALLLSITMTLSWGLLLPSTLVADANEPLMQVRVHIDRPMDFSRLLALHPDIVWYDKDYVEVITDQEELDEIDALGLMTEIVHQDVVQFYQSRLPAKAMGAYRDLSEVNAKIDSIVAVAPTIVSPKISIGQSIEGRDLWAFKISDNPTVDEAEPEVLYTACIHAREVITPELLFYFIDDILQRYGSDPYVTDIVNNRELWFIPMINPDGYYFNEIIAPGGGGMWRKNMRNSGDGNWGVDLNRNYGYMWGYDDYGSSPDTWDETYRGTGPFSEPETQAIRDFSISHEFVLAINYHAFSNLILWAWGYSTAPCPDDHIMGAIGQTASQWNHYAAFPTWMLYFTNGGANDWQYGEQSLKSKTYSYTVEVGDYYDGFWPAAYRIPQLISENLQPNYFYADIADNPFYTDDAGSGLGSLYSPQPFILDPGGDTVLTVTMKNEGHYSYDNPFSVYVNYQNGYGWIDVSPVSGVIPYGEPNTTELTVTISAPEGALDPSMWQAEIVINHDGVSSPRIIPVSLEVASELTRPQYADLATACKRIRIFNNGQIGTADPDASLDYIDECDTFNVMTNPAVYLYAASPVVCRLGPSADTLMHTKYGRLTSAADGLYPVSEMLVDSSSYADFTYAEAEYQTGDRAVGLKSKYYVPRGTEGCEFVAVSQEFKNLTNDTLHDVLIGLFMDWNIPSDSGTMNSSGYHIDTTVTTVHEPDDDTSYLATIYQTGAEFYDDMMGDCGQYADQRLGGIIAAPYANFRNAQILRNEVYVYQTGPFGDQAPLPAGAIYKMMKENTGFTIHEPYDEYDYPNLSLLVTFGEYDLPPGLAYTYVYTLLTGKEGLAEYLYQVEMADTWMKSQPEILLHCLDLPGDANNDLAVNVADAVYLLAHIFTQGSPGPICPAEGDANGDAKINIGDAVYLINYVFLPGSPAPVPGPEK